MLKRMQIGAIYPQTELGGDPRALDSIGRAVEKLGFDYILMFDHVAGAVRDNRDPPLSGPYSDKQPFHDPLVSFAYLAGITQRIELVTGVLVLPQRQTLLVARQAADVDLLSGGRLRLGVGLGWNYVEFEALGQDFHTRGVRMEEQIILLRRLWSESPISFKGRFDRIDRAGLNPLPKRAIPIYCGGAVEPGYKRAAKLADGFIFGGPLQEKVLPAWQRLQRYLLDEGRSIEAFGADYMLTDATNPQSALDQMHRWQDAGGTHVAIRTMGLGFSTAQQHLDFLSEILQKFR
jgi:probable F420-dependent oxidoreductase